jgi:ubiquinone/menaquinone biosynthesis C-methylase UbiE
MSNDTASITNRLTEGIRDRLPLTHRSDEHELIDQADVSPSALAANLRDLSRFSRLPGGAGTSITALVALAPEPAWLSIVDVGTGGGDLPLGFARYGRRLGGQWRVTAVDNRRDVVAYAASHAAHTTDVDVRLADARELPLEDGSVDIAHASLLLHHLDPAQTVEALREMRRVARIGVVVNDLRRGPLAFALAAPAVLAFGRTRMTRHDGLISLRRAYTLPELDDLLAAAGLEVVWRSNRLLPRVVTAAVPRRSR